jgi:hypothetical protein
MMDQSQPSKDIVMHPVKLAFLATVQDKLSRTNRYVWNLTKDCSGQSLLYTADKLETLSKKLAELSLEIRNMNTSIILLEDEEERKKAKQQAS